MIKLSIDLEKSKILVKVDWFQMFLVKVIKFPSEIRLNIK